MSTGPSTVTVTSRGKVLKLVRKAQVVQRLFQELLLLWLLRLKFLMPILDKVHQKTFGIFAGRLNQNRPRVIPDGDVFVTKRAMGKGPQLGSIKCGRLG